MIKVSLFAVSLALLTLVGCSNPTTSSTSTVAVKSMTGPATVSVLPGKSTTISLIYLPATATTKTSTFKAYASDGTTATTNITVSSAGVVTAGAVATTATAGKVMLGDSYVVIATSTSGGIKTKIKVNIEKDLPATATKTTPVATTAATTTAANGKAVPSTVAVGTSAKKSSSNGAAFSSKSLLAKAAALGKTGRSSSKVSSQASLYFDLMSPTLTVLNLAITDSAVISAAGLLPVTASFDPTATDSDTDADKTITITAAMATMFGNSTAAGNSIVLSGWRYHTLEQYESDGTTENYYYAQGYTQEIEYVYNGVHYWLDFNDDSTLVLTELYDTATSASLIVTGDFINLIQTMGYSNGTTNYGVSAYFDSGSTTNGFWASVSFDTYDGSSGTTANFDGYMDDDGAFLVGFLVTGTDDIPATATAYVESLSGSGSTYTPVYLGTVAIDDDTGTFGTMTKVSSGSAFSENSQSLKLYATGTFK